MEVGRLLISSYTRTFVIQESAHVSVYTLTLDRWLYLWDDSHNQEHGPLHHSPAFLHAWAWSRPSSSSCSENCQSIWVFVCLFVGLVCFLAMTEEFALPRTFIKGIAQEVLCRWGGIWILFALQNYFHSHMLFQWPVVERYPSYIYCSLFVHLSVDTASCFRWLCTAEKTAVSSWLRVSGWQMLSSLWVASSTLEWPCKRNLLGTVVVSGCTISHFTSSVSEFHSIHVTINPYRCQHLMFSDFVSLGVCFCLFLRHSLGIRISVISL